MLLLRSLDRDLDPDFDLDLDHDLDDDLEEYDRDLDLLFLALVSCSWSRIGECVSDFCEDFAAGEGTGATAAGADSAFFSTLGDGPLELTEI